jgi:hypothetical protein
MIGAFDDSVRLMIGALETLGVDHLLRLKAGHPIAWAKIPTNARGKRARTPGLKMMRVICRRTFRAVDCHST